MKKVLKIIAVSIASLLAILLITIGVLSRVIFTPEKLTPIVRNLMDETLICEYELGEVELTFFSTFPQFGLQIDGLTIINPLPEAPTDTVISSSEILASVDLKSLWKKNELIVSNVHLKHAKILAFTDSLGNVNYDIIKPDEEPDTTDFELPFDLLQIDKIYLADARVIYQDVTMDMIIILDGLNGDIKLDWRDRLINGKLNADARSASFYWDETDYLKNAALELKTPFSFDLEQTKLTFHDALLTVNDMDFDLYTMIHLPDDVDEILLDVDFKSVELQVTDVIDLLSLPYGEYLEGITATGETYVDGTLKGAISDSELPIFTIHANFHDVDFEYVSLPHKLLDVKGIADIEMDMNHEENWFVKVYDFDAKTKYSHLSGSAFVDQLTEDMRFDVKANLNLNLVDAKPFLPDDMPLDIKGMAKGHANIKFLYSQFDLDQYEKMFIDGKFKLHDFIADYDTTIHLQSKWADVVFDMPNAKSKQHDFIILDINTDRLDVAASQGINAVLNDLDLQLAFNNLMDDNLPIAMEGAFNSGQLSASMGDSIQALIKNPKGDFDLEMDTQDSTAIPQMRLDLAMQQLIANMDTINVDIDESTVKLVYRPDETNETHPYMEVDYQSDKLMAHMGADHLTSDKISVNASLIYDETQENLMLQWTPLGYVKLKNAVISMAQIGTDISIPSIDFDFTPDELLIYDSRLIVDKSDFQLTGQLKNISGYFRDEALLTGDFNFRSHTTDVNKLMAMFNGLGYEKTELLTEEEIIPEEDSYSGPFMVPKGIDISLYTSINQALFANDTARNVEGTLTVRDGTMVLESMLFTTSAAKMQLTAMYKTQRKNHLFLGMDLHLLEIEIAELLDLIPDMDSIMPMLSSFAGKGEFHIAIETYLDSAYNLKPSTLRGASSIRGIDLVLMDGETFTEIAKTLRFNKKTENKIDSIAAEFTVFREEVDIYPFLIVMDQYKAIVEGRHNLDMNFDYHISLIDNPLHLRLGVDVKGNLDDMKIRPVKCKYANMYRPARRTEVDTRKLALRELIRRELLERLKEE